MKKINLFLILGLAIACFLITGKSIAQYPSAHFMQDYYGTSDSGVFYCLTDTDQFTCTACSPDPTYCFWLHLRNMVGHDMAGCYIYKVELDIMGVDPTYPTVDHISLCRPCKNFGCYFDNGFPKPWLMQEVSPGTAALDTPRNCQTITPGINTGDWKIQFTPPSGYGNTTGTSTTPYYIFPLDHWMVSFCTDQYSKIDVKVYFKNPDGSDFAGNPVEKDDIDQHKTDNACPSCSQCATNSPPCTP